MYHYKALYSFWFILYMSIRRDDKCQYQTEMLIFVGKQVTFCHNCNLWEMLRLNLTSNLMSGCDLHFVIAKNITHLWKFDFCWRLDSFAGTFVGFRISVMAWMSRWMLINKDLIPLVFYSLGSIGLAVMTVMNIVLFYRLLQSDFIRKKESTIKVD